MGIPVCYERSEDGSNSSFVPGPRMDIFPDTVAAFAATTDAGDGGRRLKWDAGFPTLADADGNGLRASAKGGIDPNDARWDSDGDTLSDGFELARRQEGQDFSPQVCDTDGDLLPDVQEAEYGTNPNSRDTDNDGLKDNEEIRHRVMNCTNGKLVVTNNWAGGVEIMIAPGGMPITTADGAADLPGPGRVTGGQLVAGLRSSRGRGQPHRQLHRHHPLGRPRGQRQ